MMPSLGYECMVELSCNRTRGRKFSDGGISQITDTRHSVLVDVAEAMSWRIIRRLC